MQQQTHDYSKPAQSSAVEALRRSADAATTVKTKGRVVIAMGSSKLPPGSEKMQEEGSAPKVAAEVQMKQSRPVTASPVHAKRDEQSKATKIEVDNNVGPVDKNFKARATSPELRGAAKPSREEPKTCLDLVSIEKDQVPNGKRAHHETTELGQKEPTQRSQHVRIVDKCNNDIIAGAQPFPAIVSRPQPA